MDSSESVNRKDLMHKIDLHIHTGSDHFDDIEYSDEQLIDRAVELGFSAIAITNHRIPTVTKELIGYAAGKGVLLIPGVELEVSWKHVLLYNVTNEDAAEIEDIKDFNSLRRFKQKRNHMGQGKDVLVIAPHPFFVIPICLGKQLQNNIDLFDAVEHSFFFCRSIDRNRKAIDVARRNGKAIVFSSDLHVIERFGESYCMIDVQLKDGERLKFHHVKDAIINRRVKNKIRVMQTLEFIGNVIRFSLGKNI